MWGSCSEVQILMACQDISKWGAQNREGKVHHFRMDVKTNLSSPRGGILYRLNEMASLKHGCENEAYTDESISAFSSSGSRILSQKVESDPSADDCDMSAASASFNWDANLARSHCMNPGMGLRVAKVCRQNEKRQQVMPGAKQQNWNLWYKLQPSETCINSHIAFHWIYLIACAILCTCSQGEKYNYIVRLWWSY